MRALVAVAVAIGALLFACQPPLPASAVCTAPAECQQGLSCLSFGISENGVCRASTSKVCTITCGADADCASLKGVRGNETFKCFQTCADAGVPATCGAVAQ
ncbi:MAG: hypothetical protein HYZ28_22040 [Myxococcales bacterium]|nr:hypothetical protein [Myxococcales bacterium]